MRGKQPKPAPGDDTLRVSVIDEKLVIAVVSADEKQETTGYIRISEYNAWALLGLLSLFVGLKLPPRIAKRIKV